MSIYVLLNFPQYFSGFNYMMQAYCMYAEHRNIRYQFILPLFFSELLLTYMTVTTYITGIIQYNSITRMLFNIIKLLSSLCLISNIDL